MRCVPLLVALGGLVLATPGLASAQGGDLRAGDTARIHLGPIGLKPRIALDRIGVDTNAGNDPLNPQRDFMIAFVPGVDTFLPIGRGLLTGKTSYEIQYLQTRVADRGANLSQSARFDLGLTRFTPYFMTEYLSTSRRPSIEVDARVHQATKTVGAGASAKVGGRTTFTGSFVRSFFEVDQQIFEGVDLSDALGRRTDTMSATFDRVLTPLTTFSIASSVQHDRFPGSSTRNADSATVMPSLTFKPSALMSGHASVGLMRFRPLDPEVRGFTGLVASVDLSYVLRDWTKLNVKVDRNVSYSFENNAPYFVDTGAMFEISQNLGGKVDLIGRFGRRYLKYREIDLPAASTRAGGRLDRTVTYGLGWLYRLSDDTRAGFSVDYDRRMSPIEGRQYDGYRFGGTFIYAY